MYTHAHVLEVLTIFSTVTFIIVACCVICTCICLGIYIVKRQKKSIKEALNCQFTVTIRGDAQSDMDKVEHE